MTEEELAECAVMLARYARLIPWQEDREVLHGLAECTDHLLEEVRRLREALEEIALNEPDEKSDGTILGERVHDAEEMAEIAYDALHTSPSRTP